MMKPKATTPLILLAMLAGCSASPTGWSEGSDLATAITAESSGGIAQISTEGRWLAAVRSATTAFHDFDAAVAAGYSVRATDCFESAAGGMGYHYLDPSLLDAQIEADHPELLLYEPQPQGRLKLVAVEYAVPYEAWPEDAPPALHGVPFERNDAFRLWVLHAWIWQANPAGVFAGWNPTVSCRDA